VRVKNTTTFDVGSFSNTSPNIWGNKKCRCVIIIIIIIIRIVFKIVGDNNEIFGEVVLIMDEELHDVVVVVVTDGHVFAAN
jgi:hypothetical protein